MLKDMHRGQKCFIRNIVVNRQKQRQLETSAHILSPHTWDNCQNGRKFLKQTWILDKKDEYY